MKTKGGVSTRQQQGSMGCGGGRETTKVETVLKTRGPHNKILAKEYYRIKFVFGRSDRIGEVCLKPGQHKRYYSDKGSAPKSWTGKGGEDGGNMGGNPVSVVKRVIFEI